MNNPPKKYTKVNGVVKLNPEYKRWKEAFGESAAGEAAISNKVTKIQVNLYAAQLVSTTTVSLFYWMDRMIFSAKDDDAHKTFLFCFTRKMWLVWARELQIPLQY